MQLTDAQHLAFRLLTKYGLSEWTFCFDHAKRRFGSCQYHHKRITLSRHLTLLNSEEDVRDAILHEIAHALTPGHRHDAIWRATCRNLGASDQRCYDSSIQPVQAKYYLSCNTCGLKIPRYRQTSHQYFCRACCKSYNRGKPDKRFQLSWIKIDEREKV